MADWAVAACCGLGLRCEGTEAKRPEGPALSGQRPPVPTRAVSAQVQLAHPGYPVPCADRGPAPVTRLIHIPPPADFTGIDAPRSGRPPARDPGPGKKFRYPGCARGRGLMTPSLPGAPGPAGTRRLRLVLLWPRPGVIITQAAHRRPTGSRRLDGGRGRDRVPGQIGGAARPRLGVPIPGAGRGAACPGAGWPGCRNCGAGTWPG